MSTAKPLHSVRRLLAFVALVLSLLLVGVAQLVLEFAHGPLGTGLVVAGLAATVVSGFWFFLTLLALGPTDDTPRGAERDGDGAAAAGNDGRDG